MKPVPIGIAVVEQGGYYLVGTRGHAGPLAGYSEFPGGKCLEAESPERCAVRECIEETGLEVAIDRLLTRLEFTYPHATVDLSFFLAHPVSECDLSAEYHGFRWVTREHLGRLTFPDANVRVVEILCCD